MSEAEPPANLLAVAHALRRANIAMARRLRALRAPHGLSASKVSVLGRLTRVDRPLSASEVAELERLQPQSLTRILADLEARGLISRARSATDRRQILLGITAAGRALLVADARRQNAWLAAALEAKLAPHEIALLMAASDLLTTLAEID
jgi:DNA-binding MarR family transcriptional regulator